VGEKEGWGTGGEKGERCTRWEREKGMKGDVWGGSKEGMDLDPIGGEVEIEVAVDERAGEEFHEYQR